MADTDIDLTDHGFPTGYTAVRDGKDTAIIFIHNPDGECVAGFYPLTHPNFKDAPWTWFVNDPANTKLYKALTEDVALKLIPVALYLVRPPRP